MWKRGGSIKGVGIQQHGDGVRGLIGQNQVGKTIRVEVIGGQGDRAAAGGEIEIRRERSIAQADQNGSSVGGLIGNGEIGTAIGVEIVGDDSRGARAGGISPREW